MIFLAISASKEILLEAMETFSLTKDVEVSTDAFGVYKKDSIVFVHVQKVFAPNEVLRFAQEHFQPHYITWLGFAK